MRDIRRDLKERIDALTKEKQFLQTRIAEIEKTETGIRILLEREEQGFPTSSTPVATPRVQLKPLADVIDDHNSLGGTPLAKLILKVAGSDRARWRTLEEFKEGAEEEGYDFGKKSPGRTLHWALVGLTANRRLECDTTGEDRKYRIKEEK